MSRRAGISERALRSSIVLLLLALPFDAARGQGFIPQSRRAAPRGTVALRGGFFLPQASSPVFQYSFENLTLTRGDLRAPTAAVDLGVNLTGNTDLVLTAGRGSASKASKYQTLVEGPQDMPIVQQTELMVAPVEASLRVYLLPRDRFTVYLGGGAGILWHRLRQAGDFVELTTMAIYTDTVEASGWQPSYHGGVGLELGMTQQVAVQVDARYRWAKAESQSYVTGEERADLSGLQLTAGLAVKF